MFVDADFGVNQVRRAFSLIEMLVVIAIIGILAGLIIAVVPMMQNANRRTRTQAIIGMLHTCLGQHASEHGAAPTPAEHPLAWSAAPRLAFAGNRGRTVDAMGVISTAAASWQILSTTGEAIAGLEDYEVEIDSAKYPAGSASRIEILSRLIHSNDVFLGSTTVGTVDAPMFAGVPRHWLGVLGVPMGDQTKPSAPVACPDGRMRHIYPAASWGTRFRKIPPPQRPVTSADLAAPPYDYRAYSGNWAASWKYDDLTHVTQGWNDPLAASRFYDWLLAAGAILDELRALKAVANPDDDTQLTSGSRFWSDDVGKDNWEPGRMRTNLDGTGAWRRYRLRHLAFVDSWNNELLYFHNSKGNPVFLSAGRDQCFRIAPGSNRVIDTDLTSATFLDDGILGGDDADARNDNLAIEEVR